MTDPALVCGRPVTGTRRTHGRDVPDQKPIEGFVEWIDLILGVPGVEAVKWTQYTPYWNDGEPCTFSTGEFYVRLAGRDDHEGDAGEGWFDSYDLGTVVGEGHDTAATAEGAKEALEHVNWQGVRAYHVALQQAFGDHAEVVATTDGFEIEEYEHE